MDGVVGGDVYSVLGHWGVNASSTDAKRCRHNR